MKVEFYGHVRQYHNIKQEIDANIQRVLESGEYVQGPMLKQFAFGEDDRPLELGDEIKSISGEETFLKDTDDRKVLRACLRTQADDIATRLKRRRLGAHTVQVKVRYGDFTTLSRSRTLDEPTDVAETIWHAPPKV